MFKQIIVDLDEANYNKKVFDLAGLIAQNTEGTVLGIVNVNIDKIEMSIGSVPLGGAYYAEKAIDSKIKEAKAKAETALKEFQEYCIAKKIKHEGIALQGHPFQNLVQEGKTADVIITGLQNYKTAGLLGDDNALHKLLKISTCPVVAVPKDFKVFNRVLITYDGSPASSRAMKSFVQLSSGLPQIKQIIVININTDEETAVQIVSPAVKYMEAHGLSVQHFVAPGEPKEAIYRKASEMGVPLIVLGAIGENFLKDFVWGSTTGYFIEKNEFPLLVY